MEYKYEIKLMLLILCTINIIDLCKSIPLMGAQDQMNTSTTNENVNNSTTNGTLVLPPLVFPKDSKEFVIMPKNKTMLKILTHSSDQIKDQKDDENLQPTDETSSKDAESMSKEKKVQKSMQTDESVIRNVSEELTDDIDVADKVEEKNDNIDKSKTITVKSTVEPTTSIKNADPKEKNTSQQQTPSDNNEGNNISTLETLPIILDNFVSSEEDNEDNLSASILNDDGIINSNDDINNNNNNNNENDNGNNEDEQKENIVDVEEDSMLKQNFGDDEVFPKTDNIDYDLDYLTLSNKNTEIDVDEELTVENPQHISIEENNDSSHIKNIEEGLHDIDSHSDISYSDLQAEDADNNDHFSANIEENHSNQFVSDNMYHNDNDNNEQTNKSDYKIEDSKGLPFEYYDEYFDSTLIDIKSKEGDDVVPMVNDPKSDIENVQSNSEEEDDTELEENYNKDFKLPDLSDRDNTIVDQPLLENGHIAAIVAGLLAFLIVCLYLGIVLWRNILDHKYGMRERLVTEDDYYHNNDTRHFEL